jgi:hypothetical protein
MIFSIILIIIIITFVVFLSLKNSPRSKGKAGEKHVHNILMQLPEEYTVLDDVVLQTSSGTTQIDHVVISKYGVFAIETKNYRGEIYGDDDRQEWTQIITTDVRYMKKWYKTYTYVTKNHFYNPVKQSLSHARALNRVLKEWPTLKVVPIVVFTGSAIIDDVSSMYHVIYDSQLLATIQSYNMPCVTDADLRSVVSRLSQKNIREQVDDSTHVSNVYDAKQKFNDKIASGICPLCGGKLVQRNGRYGSFYGCSHFPSCRFTTH